MPRIPTYERQVNIQARYQSPMDSREIAATASQGAQMAETGRQIRELGSAAAQMQRAALQDQAEIDFVRNEADIKQRYMALETDLREKDGANIKKYQDTEYGLTSHPDTHYSQVTKGYLDLVADEKYMKSKNPFYREMWDKHIARFSTEVDGRARLFESQQRVLSREIGLGDSLETDARTLFSKPELLDSTITKWRNFFEKVDDPKTKEVEGYAGLVRPQFLATAKGKIGVFAETVFEKMVSDDPKTAYYALKKLEKDTKKLEFYAIEPDKFTRLMEKAKSAASAVSAMDQYKLETALEDHIASLRNTGGGNPQFKTKESVKAAVMAVMDPLGEGKGNERASVMADKAWREISIASKTYGIANSMRWETDANIAKRFQSLTPSGGNAADEEKIRNGVAQTVNTFMQQRQADPGGYWQQHPAVQMHVKAGNIGEARTQMMALQIRNGAQPWEIAVLSESERANEIKFLSKADPNTITTQLRNFQARYGGADGKYAGQADIAWRQLTTGQNALPPEYMFAARAMGTSAERRIVSALTVDPKMLRDNMGTLSSTGNSYADLEAQANVVGQPFRSALTGNMPGRLGVYDGMKNIAIKIAAQDVINSGGQVSSADALKRAFKEVAGSFDTTGGTYYIPLPKPGQPNNYVMSNIHANATYINRNVKELTSRFQIAAPGSRDPGLAMQPGYTFEQYVGTLAKEGYWVTNNNGTGLMLVHATTSGVEPVTTVSGALVEMSFEELSKQPKQLTPNRKESKTPFVPSGRAFGGWR